MGTRSLTHVFDDRGSGDPGDERPLVTIYRQMDGYPSGHGEDLAAILRGRRIVNGIGAGMTSDNASNGMGCLAATIIGKLKADSGIGGIYLMPAGSEDHGEDYVYLVNGSEGQPIRLTVLHANDRRKPLYDGPADAFDGAAVQAEAALR
jgi:hypothetical protein